jgi:DNA-binding protein Fis
MHLPPLRDRKGDIPLLADYFIRRHAGKNSREPVSVAPDAMEVLCHYNWRGNVRELENVLERALLLSGGKDIQPLHLLMGPAAVTAHGMEAVLKKSQAAAAAAPGTNGDALGIAVGMSMAEAEEKLIFETLRKLGGNRTQAAKVLDISIRTLRNKLNEYAAAGRKLEIEMRGGAGQGHVALDSECPRERRMARSSCARGGLVRPTGRGGHGPQAARWAPAPNPLQQSHYFFASIPASCPSMSVNSIASWEFLLGSRCTATRSA